MERVSLEFLRERKDVEWAFLTGCAEKSIRGWRKTEAHIVAVSWWERRLAAAYLIRGWGRTNDPDAGLSDDGGACRESQ